VTIGINGHRWRFLRRENAARYIEIYNRHKELGWKELSPITTGRQLATARAILDRLSSGQKGVLLADDVGLGKTTVATFCALVFAGTDKRVRIVAPNEMMARRWRQELEIHIDSIGKFATHLDLHRAGSRLGRNIERLTSGSIAVTTHQKASQLACDLLIVDEAHRTRSEKSRLAQRIRGQRESIGCVLALTATPFSIDPNDLARLLSRIGGRAADKPMRAYAKALDDLWRGRCSGDPDDLAKRLVVTARSAVEAMRPFVIRHGIDDLSAKERLVFGRIDEGGRDQLVHVPGQLLEAMLRTDRALALGRRCGAWSKKRQNDPRYHVATSKLKEDLGALLEGVARKTDDDDAALTLHHGRIAQDAIRASGTHPKIASTVALAREFVEVGEKVLIFCDHHSPAAELSVALAKELHRQTPRQNRSKDVWRAAWSKAFSQIRADAEKEDGRSHSILRLDNFLDWLVSDGIRLQIESWIGSALQQANSPAALRRLVETKRARNHDACKSIADHAKRLYGQLVDRESGSTRSILLNDAPSSLPGASKARVIGLCDAQSVDHPEILYPGEPDMALAIFNSPFGPDVLVATDRLSEGVDLHGFCRHLIHHELDPSPVRTVQRNGRIRRVNSWAAQTKKPIRILYPALRGTRDEKLVRIMHHRLFQFDLLLGGVRAEVNPDEELATTETAIDVLNRARQSLGRIRLDIKPSR
jgi:hypothetical protein